MKVIKQIAVASALIASPVLAMADSSYKDVYQFGTGSQGEVVKSSQARPGSIGFAYDIYANNSFSSERTEMAVLEQGEKSMTGNVSSVPGYIGNY